jgi:hypothetical protein
MLDQVRTCELDQKCVPRAKHDSLKKRPNSCASADEPSLRSSHDVHAPVLASQTLNGA